MSGVCRRCGCTQARTCPGGCQWATPDLCTVCADRMARDNRGTLLRRVLDRLPTRVQDWLGGLAVDILWRAAAREQVKARTVRDAERQLGGDAG